MEIGETSRGCKTTEARRDDRSKGVATMRDLQAEIQSSRMSATMGPDRTPTPGN